MKRKLDHGDNSATSIAVAVLGWLAEDGDRILPFLASSGLAPETIRTSARDAGFLGGILDHVMSDEAVLLACARALDLKPERIGEAWRRLQPPEFDGDA